MFLDFLSNDYFRGRNILILATVSSNAFLIFPRALSFGFGFMATFVRIESRFLARDSFGLAFFGVVLVLFRIYSVSPSSYVKRSSSGHARVKESDLMSVYARAPNLRLVKGNCYLYRSFAELVVSASYSLFSINVFQLVQLVIGVRVVASMELATPLNESDYER